MIYICMIYTYIRITHLVCCFTNAADGKLIRNFLVVFATYTADVHVYYKYTCIIYIYIYTYIRITHFESCFTIAAVVKSIRNFLVVFAT
jgi:hypothetical protein